MKKRKPLKLDRETIRQLTDPELKKQAGAVCGGTSYTNCCRPATMDYAATCYSCDATWCNQACSMNACDPATSWC
jgi:hypothetical protein